MAAIRPMMNSSLKRCCTGLDKVNTWLFNAIRSDLLIQQRPFHLGVTVLKPRKRYEWKRSKPPANTKLAIDREEQVEIKRAYGGRTKVKAAYKNKGSYILQSQGLELQVPILDVVYSESSKDHVANKIMTKGSIVQLDGTEFKNRLGNIISSKSAESAVESQNLIPDDDANSNNMEQAVTESKPDNNLLDLMNSGKLYGRITTRPGQVGLCDGYILEGTELQSMLEKLQLNETK